ncbi:HAD-IA family hydrolase [Sporolactobacillus vineae]|uniref:HAD-IA family hydrolase n=1 Tax=Sporolactobacillus vineae TaxID=444463 RepID=UPI0002889E3C|nr:HAD-IA family hydrolase [Sporolactobacillus vineae]
MNILWDFDGTLFNTYPVYTGLIKQILGDEASSSDIYGQLKKSFGEAFRYFQLSGAQTQRFFELYQSTPAESFVPFKDVEKVLDYAQKNFIVTHNDRENLYRMLRPYQFDSYFTETVTSDDGYPKKPNSLAYRCLKKKYQIDLVIGDRLLDIVPGHELGIRTCLFQNHEPGADFYLDEYKDFFRKVVQTESTNR